MWLLFIVTIFWSVRNTIWSGLIHFDPFSTDLIQSDQKIDKFENLMIYFIRNLIWSSLIHFGQILSILIKRLTNLNIWCYISMIISSEIQFDQVWSILIHFGQIWFNLIKNKIENWKSDDIFQWLFHQKLKMWKKWEIWQKRLKMEKSILRAFARTRAKNWGENH